MQNEGARKGRALHIAAFLPGWARRPIARMIEFVTPSNDTVRTRWLRRPQLPAGAEVCLFVTFAPGGAMQEHSLYHARAWADAGFSVVLLLITDTFDRDVKTDGLAFASGLLVRENRGYDFGAWASALVQLPEIRATSLVALVNDSVYGPLDTFGRMLERVREMDSDVIGATESAEFGRHFQSFLLFFKPAALNSEAFWHFWQSVRAGGRIVAIYRYELGLLNALEQSGLKCASLFPTHGAKNPTLTRWRQLVGDGFPYVKVALLRDNLFDADLSEWPKVLSDRGYNPELAQRHLGQPSGSRFLRPFERWRL